MLRSKNYLLAILFPLLTAQSLSHTIIFFILLLSFSKRNDYVYICRKRLEGVLNRKQELLLKEASSEEFDRKVDHDVSTISHQEQKVQPKAKSVQAKY